MTHGKNKRKTNGHAGPHDRTNGSAPASTARGGISAHGDRAASDDASGAAVAIAATAIAAGADREACAYAAPSPPNGAPQQAPRKKPSGTGKTKQVPPGEGPLPGTADEFVDEIHSRIDLFKLWQGLLRSRDPKIKQRAVERLTDLRYKTGSSQAEEPQQIIFDAPRPNRD